VRRTTPACGRRPRSRSTGKRVGRSVGTGSKRRAGHPDDRRRGRLADRVPAHAELGHPAQQPANPRRKSRPPPQGELPGPCARRSPKSRVPGSCIFPRGKNTFDDSPEERQAFYELAWRTTGFGKIITNYQDMMLEPRRPTPNGRGSSRTRSAAWSGDPATAGEADPGRTMLTAGKRPPYVTDYYEAFNRPNVLAGRPQPDAGHGGSPKTGIETAEGLREFDIIVLGDRIRLPATGRASAGSGSAGRGRPCRSRSTGPMARSPTWASWPTTFPNFFFPRRAATARRGNKPAVLGRPVGLRGGGDRLRARARVTR